MGFITQKRRNCTQKEKREKTTYENDEQFLFAVALAAGTNSFAAGTSLTAGANIKQLTREAKALELHAERPQEHRALAADYRQLAQLQRDESTKLDERADRYAQTPIFRSEKFKRATIDNSRYFAGRYRADAQKSDALAERHERLAS